MKGILISESEKKRILEMHQNATSRQYLSEQAIYNWEGGGRKIKYKVQANKYYTSRDDGKTWTELTKQEDIDWVKTNAIKPENLDKSAKTTTAPGPAVTVGQKFHVTSQAGNELQYIGIDRADKPSSSFTGKPVIATIQSIKFGTSSSGDYIVMPLSIGAVNKTGKVNYTVYCGGSYSAQITEDINLGEYAYESWYFIMSNILQGAPTNPIQARPKSTNLFAMFRDNNLSQMNKNLADSAVSYFCDGSGSLRSGWKAQIGK